MPTLYGDAIRQGLNEERERQRIEAEKQRKAHEFNIGSLLPALIAAPFTGGASLVSMGLPAALGEGVRAATGSDTDYGALASAAYNMFSPSTSARVDTPNVSNPVGNVGAWLQDAAVLPKTKQEIMAKELGYVPTKMTVNGMEYSAPDKTSTFTPDAIMKQFMPFTPTTAQMNGTEDFPPGVVIAPPEYRKKFGSKFIQYNPKAGMIDMSWLGGLIR